MSEENRIRQQNKIKALKLERINQFNQRLRLDLSRDRTMASSRCVEIINYSQDTKDYMVTQLWGELPDHVSGYSQAKARAAKRAYPRQDDGCCCIT
ncbi:unnamed protein product [Kuraishia capsulata CBS 1993]|uniref:G protein gamma domain-containing protein n=1 Tax=Kuraishia capsulata CBS 1993 TaxID=1382522 RepID=W6MJB3_9ASCO|nr:uncharacterized protein KUCA_T00002328001 [Kuraishia capsulata CBS 1993]CDK26356.1 unnamed protein product [Kuraishia capsulata CBS 1993]